jgi:group I intron endonuclease
MKKGSSEKINDNMCVYVLNKLTGEPAAYVGSTMNKYKRFNQYIKNKPKRYVEHSIKKYGWHSFQKIEIDVNVSNEKELRAWEGFYIGLFGTYINENADFGMNLVRYPSMAISKDPEVAKKISQSKLGKKMSEEQKEKLRKATKGKINIGIKRPYLSERNKTIKPAIGRVGSKHPMSKKVLCIDDNLVFDSIKDASDYYNISRPGMRYRINNEPLKYKYL